MDLTDPANAERLYGHSGSSNLVETLPKELERAPTLDELPVAMNANEFRSSSAKVKEPVEVSRERLVSAARRGDFDVVRAMIESKEVGVNEVLRSTGETAFSAALSGGKHDMCEYLLACGAHMNAPCFDDDGLCCLPLTMAVRSGDVEFVKRLVARRVNLRKPPSGSQRCAMLEAIKTGSTAMVDALCRLNVPIYTTGLAERLSMPTGARSYLPLIKQRQSLLLSIACWLQDVRLVEHLLATNQQLPGPFMTAADGAYALSLAVYRENEQIARALLRSGVLVNEQRLLKLALTTAITIDSVRMLHFLSSHGADLETITSTANPVSLLTFALQCSAMQCAHALLPLETRPDQRDKALCEAVHRGDLEFAQLMLDQALPSTEKAFSSCVTRSRCPVMLDLILGRAEAFPASVLESTFTRICTQMHPMSPDLMSVFLAHGLDVMYNAQIAKSGHTMILAMIDSDGLPAVAADAVVKASLTARMEWVAMAADRSEHSGRAQLMRQLRTHIRTPRQASGSSHATPH